MHAAEGNPETPPVALKSGPPRLVPQVRGFTSTRGRVGEETAVFDVFLRQLSPN